MAREMKRHRGSISGGYRRSTVTIPETLAKQMDKHIEKHPGMTISAFISNVVEGFFGSKRRA